jgi:3-phenylpropionate/trans-cinnamate dioxygenase ferredoxin reductase subunit
MSTQRQDRSPLLIVGAGHAGGTLAAKLRVFGYTGRICLIGAEPHLPYQRPPLSKAWLKGTADIKELELRPSAFYNDKEIELTLGTTVSEIDRAGRTVRLEDGEVLPYSTLVIATGTRPRQLAIEGADLDGLRALRTMDDAEYIKGMIGPNRRLAIVGGGYVGLEVAAVAVSAGTQVTVLERESRLLSRVASKTIADFFETEHRGKGVAIELNADVTGYVSDGSGKTVAGVRLASGDAIPCDAVVVGVGVHANTELAEQAGIDCADGIVVDENGRTSDPDIFAIGDVTYRELHDGSRQRLESVPSATELADRAAGTIVGRDLPDVAVPWFWSDQYDLKLQMAGIPRDGASCVVRGDIESRSFAVFHVNQDRLQAVECINAPRDFVAGRRAIGSGERVSLEDVAELVP